MTFEGQLGAGRLSPVRRVAIFFLMLGVIFKIVCFGGGGSFSDTKGAFLGGSVNCYESGF